MLTKKNGLARVATVAVTLVVVLAPMSTFAQRAADNAAMPRAVEQFSRRGVEPRRASGPAVISAPTGKALNEAIEAVNAKKFADARTAIGELRLDRLSPY